MGRALLSVVFCVIICSNVQADQPLTVNTDSGPVTGSIQTLTGPDGTMSTRVFKGIPYASPPVGSLRWEDPVPPTPWGQPRDATQFSPGCPQDCDLPAHTCPTAQDEDCLYLNVWTPLSQSGPLPVMFWIHGGHYTQGSGEGPLYDGTAITNFTNVVLVTINYRLGALGFLYTGTGSGDLDGNYATKDQIAALKWVQKNIANFGGDPNHVTIYGQSAGGTSVATMLVSPATQGLFHRAIMESNPIGLPLATPADGQRLAKRLSKDAGCGDSIDVACLRSQPAATIVKAQAPAGQIFNLFDVLEIFYPWVPVLGDLVPDEPLKLMVAGQMQNVPLILGSVTEEGRLFVYSAFDKSLSKLEYEAVITANWGLKVGEVLKVYPSIDGDNRDTMAQIATDYLFACPARYAASALAKTQPNTYMYVFNHSWSFDAWGANYSYCVGHVCHAEELPFVFDLVDVGIFPVDSMEQDLANSMMGTWSFFGNYSVPDHDNGWTQYNATSDVKFMFTAQADAPPPGRPIQGFRKTQCDFWDQVGYTF